MPEFYSEKRKPAKNSPRNNPRNRRAKKENLFVVIFSGLFPWKGDTTADVVRKIVFIISLSVLTVAVVLILDFYLGEKEKTTDPDYWLVGDSEVKVKIPQINKSLEGEGDTSEKEVFILEKYKQFYEDNNEFVGYISIDPYINYPVAQSQGDKDEDFYLHHNFYGKPTENGTIYADKYGEFTPTSRPHNTIIHGHNLITKNNFQPLMNYRDSMTTNGWEFLKENPIVKFDTLYEAGTYKIFSVFQINVNDVYGEYYDYWRKNYFNSKDEFYEFVTEALDRSQYYTNVDLEYGDELLTLSTCDFAMLSDVRLVVVARRLRPSESSEMDVDSFINNRENNGRDEDGMMKYKMFDAYYDMSNGGRGWGGRRWDTSLVKGIDEYLERVNIN